MKVIKGINKGKSANNDSPIMNKARQEYLAIVEKLKGDKPIQQLDIIKKLRELGEKYPPIPLELIGAIRKLPISVQNKIKIREVWEVAIMTEWEAKLKLILSEKKLSRKGKRDREFSKKEIAFVEYCEANKIDRKESIDTILHKLEKAHSDGLITENISRPTLSRYLKTYRQKA